MGESRPGIRPSSDAPVRERRDLVARLVSLPDGLRPTQEQMARSIGVSTRTIERDLASEQVRDLRGTLLLAGLGPLLDETIAVALTNLCLRVTSESDPRWYAELRLWADRLGIFDVDHAEESGLVARLEDSSSGGPAGRLLSDSGRAALAGALGADVTGDTEGPAPDWDGAGPDDAGGSG